MCRECATELRQVLLDAGKEGCVLQLSTVGGRGYIVMKDPNFKLPFAMQGEESISSTGVHFGVYVDGLVFDNIHREGIPKADWINSFACDVQNFSIEEIEHF